MVITDDVEATVSNEPINPANVLRCDLLQAKVNGDTVRVTIAIPSDKLERAISTMKIEGYYKDYHFAAIRVVLDAE
uniref:Uncharacterized protein n=1 Tax=viral metagenome TaxID=1070528 RepID=A0A6M3KSD0_9ZZZZ